jgi:hypothetical protein
MLGGRPVQGDATDASAEAAARCVRTATGRHGPASEPTVAKHDPREYSK